MKAIILIFCLTIVNHYLLGSESKNFKNFYEKRVSRPTRSNPRRSVIINSDSYKFRLERKLSSTAGIFTPICFQYRASSYGGSTRDTTEEKTIIIVGRKLVDKVDGDTIPLQKGEILWSIGTARRSNGRTYRVYSFNKGDKVPADLSESSKTCPYCNGTGKLGARPNR